MKLDELGLPKNLCAVLRWAKGQGNTLVDNALEELSELWTLTEKMAELKMS